MARRFRISAIGTITLAALVVRVLTCTWTGLTTDEANGVSISVIGTWADTFEHLKLDGNPPLFYVLTRLYAELFGHSDLALKLGVLALSVLAVPATYFICRRFLPPEPALYVAAFIAFCPPVVRFSTLVRGYVLMPVLSLLSTWAMMRLLKGPPSRLWTLGYGLSTAAMVLCHYWGAFVAAGQAATVAIAASRRWIGMGSLRRWLAGVAASLILFLPWLLFFLYQISHNLSPWMRPPLPSRVVTGFMSWLVVGPDYSLNPFELYGVVLSNCLFLFAFLAPVRLVLGEASPPGGEGEPLPTFDSRLWKLVAVASALAGLATTLLLRPVMRERYLIVLIPLFAVVFVATYWSLCRRLAAWQRLALFAGLFLPAWLPQYYILKMMPETGTPAIVREISVCADRKRDLVLVSWQSIAPAITFYLPEDLEVTTFPDMERSRFNRWDGMDRRLRDGRLLDRLLEKLQAVFDRGGSVWLVDRAPDIREGKSEEVEDLVAKAPFMDADLLRMDQIRDWLRKHSVMRGDVRLAPGRDFDVFLSVWKPQPEGAPALLPQAAPAGLMR